MAEATEPAAHDNDGPAPLERALRHAGALAARAETTRRRDLAALLTFAARRRMARARRSDVRRRPPLSDSLPEVRAEAPRAAATAPDGAPGTPQLLERQDVTESLLRLRLSRPPGFTYRAGQHVKMGLAGLTRKYSLVSAPHQRHLEFFVELVPGGRLSERLRSVTPGTTMALGRAKGGLQVDESRVNQLLIATVTGIAPYVSLVRDHLHRRGGRGRATAGVGAPAPRFVVLHGASHADELGYGDELAELARHRPSSVTYVPTVSRPDSPRNAGWRGATGRVEAVVDELLDRFGLSADDTAVFACGNPDMVRNLADRFRRRGFVTHTEPFD